MQHLHRKLLFFFVYFLFLKTLAQINCYSNFLENNVWTWDDSLNDIKLENGEKFFNNFYNFEHFGSYLTKNDIRKHLFKRPDFNYNLALHYLVCNGRPEVIKYLIGELKADVNFEIDGQTPINRCWSSIEKLRILIDHGANVNHLDAIGRNIGFDVIRGGKFDLLSFLIEKQLDVNVIDKNNNTIISSILSMHGSTRTENNNQAEIIKLLNKKIEKSYWNRPYIRNDYGKLRKNTILEDLLQCNYSSQMDTKIKISILTALFEIGVDFKAINKINGWTLLHYAENNCYDGYKQEIVDFLLNHGLDPTILDKENRTAKELGKKCDEAYKKSQSQKKPRKIKI